MKNERETCKLCPNTICYESTSNEGRVRVEINPKQQRVRDISKTLIEDCPIRLEIEQDNIEDIRNY